jgi:hypothetical protein
MSLRGIAKSVGCAHMTIYYELKRGTPPRKSNRGRIPGYPAKRGQEAYAANRKRSKKSDQTESAVHSKVQNCTFQSRSHYALLLFYFAEIRRDFLCRLIRYAVGGILIVRKATDEEVDLRSQGADVV